MSFQTDVKPRTAVESLLVPQSIAVVGASGDPTKIGAMPLRFLRSYGYQGQIYPINPGYREIDDLTCYPSVAALPGPVDLLVVTVPVRHVPAVFKECEPGHVSTALVLTSGYAELGADGAARQSELVAIAAERGIRICGPNSVGAVNLWNAVVPSISQVFDRVLRPGPVAFITQSGAVGTAVMALAQTAGLRLGYFINTGNEADLGFSDFCEYLLLDERTRIIAAYLEGIRDGRRFVECARTALRLGKPVVVLKVGRSEVGSAAARSHTGAITGSDQVYDAVFDATGVTRVGSVEELVDILKMFSAVGAPVGNRAVLVSHSGGTGVMMSDACAEEDIQVPPASAELRDRLRPQLPDFASLSNPIDMSAAVIFQPEVMVGCLGKALETTDYDVGVLSVNLMWRTRDALAEQLASLRTRTTKPLAVSWIGIMDETAQRLQESNVPAYSDPVRCIRAVARLIRWSRIRQAMQSNGNGPGTDTVDRAPDRVRRIARAADREGAYDRDARMLQEYGIPLAPWSLVRSISAAQEAAERLGYPVAAKIVSDRFTHKTDAGGVALDLATPAQLEQAIRRFTGSEGAAGSSDRYLIQPMIRDGLEVFVGGQRDPVFGPVVVVGVGGIYVEVFREVTTRLAPLTEGDAIELLARARWGALLQSFRGQPKRDTASLARLIRQVSLLMISEPLSSMDLNPVMALPEGRGTAVVDFRLVWTDQDGGTS